MMEYPVLLNFTVMFRARVIRSEYDETINCLETLSQHCLRLVDGTNDSEVDLSSSSVPKESDIINIQPL